MDTQDTARMDREQLAAMLDRLISVWPRKQEMKRALEEIKRLFSKSDSVRFKKVVEILWPAADAEVRQTRFRLFKERFNRKAAELGLTGRLATETDNRPTDEKSVWFESTDPGSQARGELARMRDELRGLVPNTAYEPTLFVRPQVTPSVPTARFPDRVERFAWVAMPDTWARLSNEARAFLKQLSTKFEAIRQVKPPAAGDPLVGFEVLAVGPHGDSYDPRVTQEARRLGISPEDLDTVLLFLSVQTTCALMAELPERSKELSFHLNLHDSIYANDAERIKKVLDHFSGVDCRSYVLELASDFQPDRVRALVKLLAEHPFGLSLEDWTETPEKTRLAALGDDTIRRSVRTVKLDRRRFAHADELRKGCELAARLLKSHGLAGLPVIIEGVETRADLDFIRTLTSGADRLFVQGYAIHPAEEWQRTLVGLNECGHPTGYGLAGPGRPRALAFVDRVVELVHKAGCAIAGIEKATDGHPIVYRLRLREGWEYLACESASACLGTEPDAPPCVVADRTTAGAEQKQRLITLDDFADELVTRRQMLSRLPEIPADRKYEPREFIRTELVELPASRLAPQGGTGRGEPGAGDTRSGGTRRLAEGPEGDALNMLLAWARDPVPLGVLLGEYGTGKTFTARVFAHEVVKDGAREPMYMDLRDLKPLGRELKLEDIIGRFLELRGLTTNHVRSLLELVAEGKWLLIFDGFDEIATHLQPGEARSLLRELRRPAENRGKVLITARDHYFPTEADERRAIRGEGTLVRREDIGPARIWRLKPFDLMRIRRFLALHLGEERVDNAMELIAAVHNLRELASRPVLLWMIVQSLDRLRKAAEEAHRSLGPADLYETFVGEWIERDAEKHQLETDVKRLFMEELARLLWDRVAARRTAGISDSELSDALRDLLRNKYGALDPGRAPIFQIDVRTAAFVVRDRDMYRFAHTSFLEFFLACWSVRRLLAGDVGGLDLPRFSREVVAFMLTRGPRERLLETAARVLAGGYVPRATENALLVLYWAARLPFEKPQQVEPLRAAPTGQTTCKPAPAGGEADEKWELVANEFGRLAPPSIVLRGANLAGLDLSGIRLVGADMTGAHLEGAKLAQADLTGAVMVNIAATSAEFDRAGLDNARLDHARLAMSSFRGASLERCSLAGADLAAASFAGAEMREADLRGANLRAAGFAGANLEACNVKAAESTEGASIDGSAARHVTPPQFGHANSLALHPVGHVVASGNSDSTVRLWDADTGRQLRVLKGHEESVRAVAFSPDGRRVASAGADDSVRVWETASGRQLALLRGHEHQVLTVAFSPDGRRLASAGIDETIRVWDADSFAQLNALRGHRDAINSVAFSPDGSRLASAGSDGTVRLWDAQRGKEPAVLKDGEGAVFSVDFSPDGVLLASAGSDNVVRLWSVEGCKVVGLLRGHEQRVSSVDFSRDGRRIATASFDKTARTWDVSTCKPLAVLTGHEDSLLAASFGPDGARIVSAGFDRTIRVWDSGSARELVRIAGRVQSIGSVAVSADGRSLVVAGRGGEMGLWDLAAGVRVGEVRPEGEPARALAFSPDGGLVALASNDNAIRLCDAKSGDVIHVLSGHELPVSAMCFSSDGSLVASAGHDKSVRLWDTKSGRQLHVLRKHEYSVLCVAFSPDGRWLASGSYDSTVVLWKLRNGEPAGPTAGAASPESAKAVVGGAGTVSAGISRGASTVTAARSKTTSCRQLLVLKGHKGSVFDVAFSLDSRLVASAGHDGTVRLWNVETGKQVQVLVGHTGPVLAVSFSSGGKELSFQRKRESSERGSGSRAVSVGYDNTIRSWDIDTAEGPVSCHSELGSESSRLRAG
ncbi:MAG: pentapeptide repeat-containing protein, partial [Planctomycetota bacterium]|nr:pentapeptide repeat-containing protein [Planctomycetota bacterium]